MQVRGTLVRGGTSKCWLFTEHDVPGTRTDLEAMLVAAYNAADRRQIDGVGGATSTTSKAAVVGPSRAPDVDIDYLFAQVGIGEGRVEWGSNCGNCATAIALYAVAKGLVPAGPRETRVRLRNVNTGSRLDAVVSTPGGRISDHPYALVPGTDAAGVGVRLIFLAPGGGSTGALLPTGRPAEPITIAGRRARLSLLDAGAPVALLRAGDLGLTGDEDPAELAPWLPELIAVRAQAAIRMGLARPGEPAPQAVPKVGIVGEPRGDRIGVRMVSMQEFHPAIGLTSAVALATATRTPGSVLAGAAAPEGPARLRLATPSGEVAVRSSLTADGAVAEVELERAARLIADAVIYLPAAA